MYDFENMDQRLIAYVNIFVCANRLQAIMDSGLEDITAKQWLAITMIDAFPEPPTLKQMAEMSGVTHQSMRQIVDRLIDKGFLEVVPDKKDKRAIRLVKTEAANNIRTKKADQNISFVYRLFDCLSNEETTAYCSALAKLCNRLNELKEENDS
jgi:DNA-binding MarR family transcriptional regulator